MLVDGSPDQTLQPKGKGRSEIKGRSQQGFHEACVNFCSADLVEYAWDNHKLDLH